MDAASRWWFCMVGRSMAKRFLWLLPILAFLSIVLPSSDRLPNHRDAVHAGDAHRPVSDLFVEGQPTELHNKVEGWGEYPSVAISKDFAYVAYDVRRGNRSQLYVCEIPRFDERPRLRKMAIAEGGESEFAPVIALSPGEGLWVAWNSYQGKRWSVWACRVEGAATARPLLLSEEDGFNSQVRVAAGENAVWFAWIQWQRGTYKVVARRLSGGFLDPVVTVYQGPKPVGRADLLVRDEGRVTFAWDEFTGDRWVIRLRELRRGKMRDVQTVGSEGYANDWEPRIAGSKDRVMVTWSHVPGMSDRCQPSLMLLGGACFKEGIDRPEDDETWRVSCFNDGSGRNWVAWATRHGYRRTSFYLRRISERAFSRTCKLVFPMKRIFMNTFDCRFDDKLVLAYEHSGSIFLYELEIPNQPDMGLPAEASTSRDKHTSGSEPTALPDVAYTTAYAGELLQVYFGDDHNHTSFSDGRVYPDISSTLARRWRNLDFMAITDHDITLTPGEFAWTSAASVLLTEEGQFVCMAGFEEGWGWAREHYGHWTVLFPREGELLLFEEGMVPEDLFAFGKKHDAVLIPHHVGISWAPYDWDHFDPTVQPVVEICSKHGVFESIEGNEKRPDVVEGSFIQDGLARGHRFGLIGASDSHNCFEAMNTEFGLMGVYAPSLTREAVLGAIKKRRTYALTGGRIVIDFRCNGKFMGESVHHSDILFFEGYVASPEGITYLEIIGDGHVVHRQDVGGPESELRLRINAPRQESYYYLRAETDSGNRAWSSPVWIIP